MIVIDTDTFLFKLIASVVFGIIVGLERELHDKPAGIKTFVTLCVGSCLLGHVSTFTDWDPMRLAVGVITGIGFLGAGALLKDPKGGSVEGLTTAAIIWTTSAISLTLGLGHVVEAGMVSAVVGTVVIFAAPISKLVAKIRPVTDDEDNQ